MPELHYRDGGAWRKAKELYYKDAGTWRKLKEAWYRDGGTWRKVFSGAAVVNPLPLSDIIHSRFGSSDVVWINFGSEGLIEAYYHGNELDWAANWFAPNESGIGASYWIRAQVVSGATPNGSSSAINTWLQLDVLRSWTQLAGAGQNRSGTLSIDIALDSSGASIVASGTVYMECEAAV